MRRSGTIVKRAATSAGLSEKRLSGPLLRKPNSLGESPVNQYPFGMKLASVEEYCDARRHPRSGYRMELSSTRFDEDGDL